MSSGYTGERKVMFISTLLPTFITKLLRVDVYEYET